MKKWLCLLTVVFALLLAGCHGSRDMMAFSMPDELDESQQLEITFWAKNDTNKSQVDIYQETVDSFQRLYPNITVNVKFYTDYNAIYNDVITNIGNQTTPNICITYPDHIATYLTGKNTMVALDELMADEKYGLGGSKLYFSSPKKDEIVPQFLSECRLSDHYYALPYMRSTEACYVNKTFVEKLGFEMPEMLTWDFVWQVSEAAMEKDENGNFIVSGQKVMIPFIYKSTDNMMIQMLYQLDAPYSTDSGEIQIFNDTTRSLLNTIARYGKNRAFSTFKISGYPANFLDAGQCIFAVDSTAGSTWMGADPPLSDIADEKRISFETVVYPVPQFDPEHPKMISQGPSICVFNKENPQEVLASWIFAQYLLTDKVQIDYSCTEGYLPVTTRAQNSTAYQDYLAKEGTDGKEHYAVKIQAVKLLLNHLENTFITPVFNGSAALRSAAGQIVENVVKSTRRNEATDDAYMEQMFADVVSLYRLDQEAKGAENSVYREMGPLPAASVVLLITLAGVWLVLIASWLVFHFKKRKEL